TFHRGYPRRLRVVIRILLLKHRDGAVTTAGINSFTALIVKYIVTISHSRQALDSFSCIRIEYEQAGREPRYDEQPVVDFVEGHRVIRQGHSGWPRRDDR